MSKKLALTALALVLTTGTAMAQSTISSAPDSDYLVESYTAYIGNADLHNSRGARLSEPWQIIRQDRANVHRFGIIDDGDTFDGFFASAGNREKLETMLRSGWIEPRAAADIVRGGALVLVEIYGRGDTGNSIHITVAR
ncbi:MAG: hypothetical protein ABS75_33955 [Pelagibacterium sp. SCN 63-23]|mgnify:CR=1 FL=1|nr:MAG: hypothetical protein ABS75_33955 [Pelagibacterium sp. SCN 63-23]